MEVLAVDWLSALSSTTIRNSDKQHKRICQQYLRWGLQPSVDGCVRAVGNLLSSCICKLQTMHSKRNEGEVVPRVQKLCKARWEKAAAMTVLEIEEGCGNFEAVSVLEIEEGCGNFEAVSPVWTSGR